MKTLLDLAVDALRTSEPEQSHDLALKAIEFGLHPRVWRAEDARLAQTVFGLRFANPIGLAAGFDKDARAIPALFRMGFGFVEAGTLTPLPQPGNPQPRLFRLDTDKALINRMGFNNSGFSAALGRLRQRRRGILGVNIGANRQSADRAADYVAGLSCLAGAADYIAINISSPNTPGLRALQSPRALDTLLARLSETRESMRGTRVPVLVKVAPDLDDDELELILGCVRRHGMDGMIVSNTTVVREGLQDSASAAEGGGLSGKPLFHRSTRMLARAYMLTGGALPLIGVGGISSPETALAKIEAGASLIQLYTGLVYEGPSLIRRIKKKLVATLGEEGASTIRPLVGRRAKYWAERSV